MTDLTDFALNVFTAAAVVLLVAAWHYRHKKKDGTP